MKNVLKICLFVWILISFSMSVGLSQTVGDDCVITDPMFSLPDYITTPTGEDCVNISSNETICYEQNECLKSILSQNTGTYQLYFNGYVNWGWSYGAFPFNSLEVLAAIMTELSPLNGTPIAFLADENGKICASGENINGNSYSAIQISYLNIETGEITNCDRITPVTSGQSYQEMFFSTGNFDSNLPLIEVTDLGTGNTDQLTMNNLEDHDLDPEIANQPELQTFGGNVLNSLGGMDGIGELLACQGGLCGDYLQIIAAQLTQPGGAIDNITQVQFEEIKNDPNIQLDPPNISLEDFKEKLKYSINTKLSDPNLLVDLLNNALGWQLPECDPSNLPSMNFGNRAAENGPDPDMFSKEIPGLGLDGEASSLPSASSMEMIKGVTGGVNLYNGSQNTNVALYTFKSNDISMPISLSSSNNGLKVDDLGSNVGQNWNLNAGSTISRIVKGLPDEFSGTTAGVGAGRMLELTPRVELFTNLGGGIGWGPVNINYSDISLQRKIFNGFRLFKVGGGPVFITGNWAPLKPSLINITANAAIPIIFGIKLQLQLGLIEAGVGLNERFGSIRYEEKGVGHQYIDDANQMASVNATPIVSGSEDYYTIANNGQNPINLLRRIHSNKKIEDASFLNDQVGNFDTWHQAISNTINGGYTYKTSKIDVEPDEFFFNFGNYSGKFLIQTDGSITTFPAFPNLNIEHTTTNNPLYNNQAQISSFKVTTPEGFVYFFGNDSFTGVDVISNKNYYLPTFYTYPEHGTERSDFGQAEIDMNLIERIPEFGLKKIDTYPATFDRHYKITNSPSYSSAWHLIKVESLLSKEQVTLTYASKEVQFNSSKTFNHVLPNFNIKSCEETETGTNYYFRTNPNDGFQSISEGLWGHTERTKWLNGRAEFSYHVTETMQRLWKLVSIDGEREERIEFTYGEKKREVMNDEVCDVIKVYRKGNLYKGWKLYYSVENFTELPDANCISGPYGEAPPITISQELTFSLGGKYDPSWSEKYGKYTRFSFLLGNFQIPLPQLRFGFDREGYDYAGQMELREFGSIMLIKNLNKMFSGYDLSKDKAIYQAEHNRTFLINVEEIDKVDNTHKFITSLNYYNISKLPKRFSIHQDLYGYHNPNNSGSPFPKLKYKNIINGNMDETTYCSFGLYGFHNKDYQSSNFWEGRNFIIGDDVKNGAFYRLELATGASISYEYESNEIPDDLQNVLGSVGAGIRVVQREENSGVGEGGTKLIKYEYAKPSMINYPILQYQDSRNYYFRGYEEKVTTSSAPQNPLFQNKNNLIGYGLVTEQFLNNGYIEHYFSTPKNLSLLSADRIIN